MNMFISPVSNPSPSSYSTPKSTDVFIAEKHSPVPTSSGEFRRVLLTTTPKSKSPFELISFAKDDKDVSQLAFDMGCMFDESELQLSADGIVFDARDLPAEPEAAEAEATVQQLDDHRQVDARPNVAIESTFAAPERRPFPPFALDPPSPQSTAQPVPLPLDSSSLSHLEALQQICADMGMPDDSLRGKLDTLLLLPVQSLQEMVFRQHDQLVGQGMFTVQDLDNL